MPADGLSPGYRVETAREDGYVRIVLAGEIDLAARDALDRAIDTAVEHRTVVIDVTEVSFFDSTGIGGIARALREGLAVSVLNPQPTVRRALEVSGIDAHIHIAGGDDHPSPAD
jgi:anti-sigma B factor antagonist